MISGLFSFLNIFFEGANNLVKIFHVENNRVVCFHLKYNKYFFIYWFDYAITLQDIKLTCGYLCVF